MEAAFASFERFLHRFGRWRKIVLFDTLVNNFPRASWKPCWRMNRPLQKAAPFRDDAVSAISFCSVFSDFRGCANRMVLALSASDRTAGPAPALLLFALLSGLISFLVLAIDPPFGRGDMSTSRSLRCGNDGRNRVVVGAPSKN